MSLDPPTPRGKKGTPDAGPARRHLPARCVLKPAHGTDTVMFLERAEDELSPADYDELAQALATDLYEAYREVNYRQLRKRLLCEELVDGRESVKDYKFFCHDGRVGAVVICHHWHSLTRPRMTNFYDSRWNRLPVRQNDRPFGPWEERPARFGEMRAMAETIARHFGTVRVDMYLRGERVYVGELTHCHNQANAVFGSLDEERLLSRVLFV